MELSLAVDLVVASESARISDGYARWELTPIWGLSLRLPHRVGAAKVGEMMFTSRVYSGADAFDKHLAHFCFPDDLFEGGLALLADDILANSWYSNQVNKCALLACEGSSLRQSHAL